jgi:hypothetical protein
MVGIEATRTGMSNGGFSGAPPLTNVTALSE